MIPSAPAKLLEGKKGLIVGIANDSSIAWPKRSARSGPSWR
jgi:enoyl-[acyl-carrier-protein] reductase (NADH)